MKEEMGRITIIQSLSLSSPSPQLSTEKDLRRDIAPIEKDLVSMTYRRMSPTTSIELQNHPKS
jgi:hypothetical protein